MESQHQSPNRPTYRDLEKENKSLKEKLSKRSIQKEASKFIFRESFFALVLGKDLKSSSKTFFSELSEGNLSNDTSSEFKASLLNRILRIGLVSLIVALLPITVLGVQTYLISKQNDKIEMQNYLIEGERRSSLAFELSSILDKLDEEIRLHKTTKGKDSQIKLSTQLEARIISISQILKPYKYLEKGTLIDNEISPERGLLFTALANSKALTPNIIESANFEFADLSNIKLEKLNLEKINFKNVNFENARLKDVEFVEADLRGASFNNSYIVGCSMHGAILLDCTFENADLFGITLGNAFVNNVKWFQDFKTQIRSGITEIEENYSLCESYFTGGKFIKNSERKLWNFYNLESVKNEHGIRIVPNKWCFSKDRNGLQLLENYACAELEEGESILNDFMDKLKEKQFASASNIMHRNRWRLEQLVSNINSTMKIAEENNLDFSISKLENTNMICNPEVYNCLNSDFISEQSTYLYKCKNCHEIWLEFGMKPDFHLVLDSIENGINKVDYNLYYHKEKTPNNQRPSYNDVYFSSEQ